MLYSTNILNYSRYTVYHSEILINNIYFKQMNTKLNISVSYKNNNLLLNFVNESDVIFYTLVRYYK